MATVVLDDRDPAIVYSGVGWSQEGSSQAEYNGTTTLGIPGGNATATLSFNGTGVTVLGTLPMNEVQISSYSIDGGEPTIFTSANASGVWYSQTFFSTGAGALAPGVEHTLMVQPLQSQLFVDLITVNGAALAPGAGGGGNTGTATVTAVTTTTKVVDPTSPTAVGNCEVRAVSHIGPIVGGVVGGVVLVCLLVVMISIAYLKRLKRMSVEEGHPMKSDLEPQMRGYNRPRTSLISPFDLSVSGQRSTSVVTGSNNSVIMMQRSGLGARSTESEHAEGSHTTLHTNPGGSKASPGARRAASPPPGYV